MALLRLSNWDGRVAAAEIRVQNRGFLTAGPLEQCEKSRAWDLRERGG